MRLDRTVNALREGLRIFRQSWRDADDNLDVLFVCLDDKERFLLERESTTFLEDVDMYQLTVEDLLATDWRIEEDTTTKVSNTPFRNFLQAFNSPLKFVAGREMAGTPA